MKDDTDKARAIAAATRGDFTTLQEIVISVLGHKKRVLNCIPFATIVPLPHAFNELHAGLKAKVNHPSLGCSDCVDSYIRMSAAILAPHLSREEIVVTTRHFIHPIVIDQAHFDGLINAGLNLRLGKHHA
jgi:hypothetical protein